MRPAATKLTGRSFPIDNQAESIDNRLTMSAAEAIPKLRESMTDKRARARRIIRALKKLYPEADCALCHTNPFQLLVATILSAQSTDNTVNKVTPILFERFPTPEALAAAPRAEIEDIIHATGFFRQKARSIQEASRRIATDFAGRVPDNMDDLLTLPGVARKTANVVLGTAFDKNDGVVVDTHIGRLAGRLGLTRTARDSKDAVRIEADLMEVLPRNQWTFVGHALIWHGRRICIARKPDCNKCSLARHCPSAGRVEKLVK
jgi:endonuclease-3